MAEVTTGMVPRHDIQRGDIIVCPTAGVFFNCLMIVEEYSDLHLRCYMHVPEPSHTGSGGRHTAYSVVLADHVYRVGAMPPCEACDRSGELDIAPEDNETGHPATVVCDACDGKGFLA